MLVLDAVNMAIASRRRIVRLVHHSDQGCQYTSVAFGKRPRESGILSSMGSVEDAYDNSAVESFIATLKCELLYRYSWPTRTHAELALRLHRGLLQPEETSLDDGSGEPVSLRREILEQGQCR